MPLWFRARPNERRGSRRRRSQASRRQAASRRSENAITLRRWYNPAVPSSDSEDRRHAAGRERVIPRTGGSRRRAVTGRGRSGVESLESRLLLTAGDLDPSFGAGGAVFPTGFTVPIFGDAGAVAFTADGKLVVAGDVSNGGGVVGGPDKADGAPHPAFGGGGQAGGAGRVQRLPPPPPAPGHR